MVAYEFKFAKVLTIREQEKSETELAYKESVSAFEKVATELYNLLKKREDTTETQNSLLVSGLSINNIHHYSNYIEGLQKRIDIIQKEVIQARSKMNWMEEKLLEKSLEVKKFEKIKEKDFEHFHQEQQRLETIQLDEISSLKFQNKEIR
ncbi:flagellar FliJ protein [Paenisporosarcina quisquiliarum]|jgi:flagellar FliJ protein|uniref:Flagellar FliJ protein n=1 Tax=Psychrobacillus psychrodurans TaxID=126157 RepID=A0A9X3L7R9_9BACI|nr:flagellar export protein FliJ [Psychrobacillus psychrodurans]SEM21863.1 flagellar FliJ protein [Paenisporosarcina quisquiliarum]MCK1996163.1 flagellar export protein FliJ [Psychrobacillus psychrodurans]MCZ8532783.1 flagellar export protein FliJ [Psychrobacillus psychrodurans]MCZ8539536.1 flagellar export protein FliJ [Psychrobacillus psychrodurans]SFM41187.1 flagellar FliJ protein [Psychrobacillus psychrodurans]